MVSVRVRGGVRGRARGRKLGLGIGLGLGRGIWSGIGLGFDQPPVPRGEPLAVAGEVAQQPEAESRSRSPADLLREVVRPKWDLRVDLLKVRVG